MEFGLLMRKGFFLHVLSCKWCTELPAVAYTNQKAVSSYILLRIKPKLPGAKTGSRRFLDATGGMDNGFSSCAAPAFCHGPGISDRGRYMRVLRAVRQLQSRGMRREGFR